MDQLQIALDHQKKAGQLLGEALMTLNLVTEEDVKRALCTQFGITFVEQKLWDFEKRLSLLERNASPAR